MPQITTAGRHVVDARCWAEAVASARSSRTSSDWSAPGIAAVLEARGIEVVAQTRSGRGAREPGHGRPPRSRRRRRARPTSTSPTSCAGSCGCGRIPRSSCSSRPPTSTSCATCSALGATRHRPAHRSTPTSSASSSTRPARATATSPPALHGALSGAVALPGARRPHRRRPHVARARGARAARRGPHQPGDRRRAVGDARDGEVPPRPHLRQARSQQPQRGARARSRLGAPALGARSFARCSLSCVRTITCAARRSPAGEFARVRRRSPHPGRLRRRSGVAVAVRRSSDALE